MPYPGGDLDVLDLVQSVLVAVRVLSVDEVQSHLCGSLGLRGVAGRQGDVGQQQLGPGGRQQEAEDGEGSLELHQEHCGGNLAVFTRSSSTKVTGCMSCLPFIPRTLPFLVWTG